MRAIVGITLALMIAVGLPAAAAPAFPPWGLSLQDFDTSVRPGDDFFRYANGAWDRRVQVADDQTTAGLETELANRAQRDIRDIAERPPSTATGRQIADLYASWMDSEAIERRGTKALEPYLARIDAVRTRRDLLRVFATPGYAAPISVGIAPDPADPRRWQVWISQGDLGLPGRDYYLKTEAPFEAYRRAYRDYAVRIFTLAGVPDPAGRADRVLALETRLATDWWPAERQRDPKQSVNPMSLKALQAMAPRVDWAAFLGACGVPLHGPLIVGETTALTAAAERVDDVPLSTWKDYLAFRFISDHARYLPMAFDDAAYGMFDQTLRGQPRRAERWKRGVELLDNIVPEAVGQLYVERRYPPETDRQVGELIEDVRAGYRQLFDRAAWMDAGTRAEALAKLDAFEARTGHPKRYIDYSALRIRRDDLLGNVTRSEAFQWRLQLSRFSQPVDRALWRTTPQSVIAYYDSLSNQITFAAAFLQPPFFDPAADPAVNYGEAGGAIGHEMGHGFDDQGRQFDASGRLRDWWSPQAAARYNVMADRLVAQFNTYEPLPGVHINGRLTLGENLGDLGGLEAAYAAYQRYVARHGPQPVLNGLSGDQRFFLAYAQSWQIKRRAEALRQQLVTNPHSPSEFRVNGIVRNFDPWYAAFGVQPGDRLYLAPEQRVHVWSR